MIDPFNSHSASFFLSAGLCAWWVQQLRRSQDNEGQVSWKDAAVGGLLAGTLALVRNQDILISAPITIWMFSRCISLRTWRVNLSGLGRAMVFATCAALVLSIQLITTLFLFGQLNSPYLIQGEHFAWTSPDFLRVLLSSGNGLWSFAPITLIAFVGCVAGFLSTFRTDRKNISPAFWRWWLGGSILVFILELYLIAAWSPEIVGGPYGSRMFTGVLPWVGVGLAILGSSSRVKISRGVRWSIYGLFFFLTINNLFQTAIMLQRF
jgi:hypothetical protein